MRGYVSVMILEHLKAPELGVWRKTALNHLDGLTYKVGLRSLEKQSTMPWLVFVRDLEKLVCHFLLLFLRCVVDTMRCFLINTRDPSRLSMRSAHHPTLPVLETWSWQG